MGELITLIISGSTGWVIGQALNEILGQVVELEDSLSEKLNQLLQSPYTTGKNALQLAVEYEKAGQDKNKIQQLDRATDYFDQAGSQLNGPEQIHAYCLAGLCSHLRQDEVARKHYLSIALQNLLILEDNELNINDYWEIAKETFVKGYIKGIRPRTPRLPDLIPPYLVFVMGRDFYNTYVDTYKKVVKKQRGNRNIYSEEDILPGFGCSVKDLKRVLIKFS